jgi:CspA family cold shock protein
MMKFCGHVSHYDATKHYAFLRRNGGDYRDAFLSPGELEKAGIATLRQGQRVAFDIMPGDRGPLAVDVELLPR